MIEKSLRSWELPVSPVKQQGHNSAPVQLVDRKAVRARQLAAQQARQAQQATNGNDNWPAPKPAA